MLVGKYFYLPWLMRNERRSRDELTHIQNTKLKRLIHHVYENVGFYRNVFKKAGIRPEDIRSVDDLSYLPIIDKKTFYGEDISEYLDRRITDINKLINIKTSGTSGSTLSFYIDPKYDQYRKALCLRPYLSNGRKLTDTVLQFSIFETREKKWFQCIGLMRVETVGSNEDVETQIRRIKKLRPSIIQGYGSVLALVASTVLAEKIDIPPPRIVFTDSELLTPSIRHKIEQAFRAPIIDIYGTFETDNIAYECSEHNGYHIAMDSVVMEFIKDGRQVKPGEQGEIVCTVLDNYAMPFIRFNLHDTACFINENCTCGRSFPLMAMIGGRLDDYLLYPDGRKQSPMRMVGHFDLLADAISEFQIIQKAINNFEVKIVSCSLMSEVLERKVKETVRNEFPSANVTVKFVDTIDREPSGKFRSVKSLAGNEV